ncbi:MAG: family 10 glycosylhydrolase, partial [Fimbriimonas sp.]
MPLVSLLALAFGAQIPAPRYENARPIPSLPGVMVDAAANGIGFAAQTAKQRNLQARILWIDCTANIERYNSPEKIESLLDNVANAGFNTIVFDIKPISGQVVYPSKFAPKLKEWRGRILPESFDPVRPMVEGAKRRGLFIAASLNAFSEGHQMFTAGPGYGKPEQQTILYEPVNVLRDGNASFEIASKLNTLEPDKIAVFSAPQQLPAPKDGAFVLTLDRFNRA